MGRFGITVTPPASSTPDVSERLLAFLRAETADPALAYAEPPARISFGFDTHIFSFRLSSADPRMGAPLILRMYREPHEGQRARQEAALTNAVAMQGYPAPHALFVCDDTAALGLPFIVLERVPGTMLLDVLIGPGLFRWARRMGEAHARLHQLDPQPIRDALAREGANIVLPGLQPVLDEERQHIDAAGLTGLRAGLDWLDAHRPVPVDASVLCHLDFHPLNILVDKGEISGVIDWTVGAGRITDAAFDVGATVALLGQGPVEAPRFVLPFVAWMRRRVLGSYLGAYRRLRPVAPGAVAYHEALRLLGFLTEAGEVKRAAAGAIPATSKPSAFTSPRVQADITRRFRQITAVTLSLDL